MHMVNIRKEAEWSKNRKEYKRVCASIKKLQKIGGVKEAEQLVQEFSEEYVRRPAFQDEFLKI